MWHILWNNSEKRKVFGILSVNFDIPKNFIFLPQNLLTKFQIKKMKKIFLLCFALLSAVSFGQFFGGMGQMQKEEDPVAWTYEVKKISETEYDLIFKGEIAPKWHIYSQKNPDGGALPTEITFEKKGVDFELVGESVETGTKKEFNKVFGVDEIFFEEKAVITQRIKLLNPQVKTIQGHLFYQACIDVCINQDKDFIFSLDGSQAEIVYKDVDSRSQELTKNLEIPLKNKELLSQGEVSTEKKNNIGIFILGFLGGFIALLTPCVFPMIPLTVSFFTKQSKDKKKGIFNALLYGFFIFFIYILLSLPFHFLDSLNPEILNTISTNVWLNVFFFVIFIFFAFSFFGYYEITLPNSWSTKMDNASNIGGVIGIFFMALTLAIVSFSCTGPILGSLLAGSLSAEGGAMQLTAGMAGFGLSLALPFAIFALFPNLLNALPKSGGWMTTTKVFLGFLELAFAFKFLSNADLVAHWGILKREIFVGIWFILFLLLGLYLFGMIRFPHDEPKKPILQLSKRRLFIGAVSFVFSGYLFLGIIGQNTLRLLSGFPPPTFYALTQTNEQSKQIVFKDFEKGIAYAKENNMPVMLDFTGWACVNCRKMEEHTWTDPQVKTLMEKFVLISLYIDDRAELPTDKQFDFKRSNGSVKPIKTIGDKWATFQTVNFQTASQPYYVLLTPNLEILAPPQQYVSTEIYKNWLETALQKFN